MPLRSSLGSSLFRSSFKVKPSFGASRPRRRGLQFTPGWPLGAGPRDARGGGGSAQSLRRPRAGRRATSLKCLQPDARLLSWHRLARALRSRVLAAGSRVLTSRSLPAGESGLSREAQRAATSSLTESTLTGRPEGEKSLSFSRETIAYLTFLLKCPQSPLNRTNAEIELALHSAVGLSRRAAPARTQARARGPGLAAAFAGTQSRGGPAFLTLSDGNHHRCPWASAVPAVSDALLGPAGCPLRPAGPGHLCGRSSAAAPSGRRLRRRLPCLSRNLARGLSTAVGVTVWPRVTRGECNHPMC